MTIHLPEHLERSILAEVSSGYYASVDDAVAEAVRLLLRQRNRSEAGPENDGASEQTAPAHKPIWEEIAEISARVPEEAWDDLPTDLSDQHDHYIYGTPKRIDK